MTSEEKKAEVCICKNDLNCDESADYRYDVPPCGQPISVFVNSSRKFYFITKVVRGIFQIFFYVSHRL